MMRFRKYLLFSIAIIAVMIIEGQILNDYHIHEKFEEQWQPVSQTLTEFYWRSCDSIYWEYRINLQRKIISLYDIPAIKDADPNSFVVCKGSFYAKDKNHVYYPIGMFDLELEDTVGPPVVSDVFIIKDADPETFFVMDEGFALDKNHMYFMGEIIPFDFYLLDKKEREEFMRENSFLLEI